MFLTKEYCSYLVEMDRIINYFAFGVKIDIIQ